MLALGPSVPPHLPRGPTDPQPSERTRAYSRNASFTETALGSSVWSPEKRKLGRKPAWWVSPQDWRVTCGTCTRHLRPSPSPTHLLEQQP